MNKDLYFQILDFVCVCKKLQYLIKQKYVPQSKETLMREFGLKNIPRRGEIEFNEASLFYWIHGTGITYSTEEREFSHTFWLGKGLDIIFSVRDVSNYHQIEFDDSLNTEMNRLEEKQLIKKLFEQAEVYYLV
jgi:hypothetical protein